MKISNAFPSKYLKASDLDDREVRLTMSHVQPERMMGDDADKPVLYFRKAKKGLVLNKTNSNAIKTAYGEETDDWEDKEVILFPMQVQFKDEMVESIRVKVPKPAKAPTPSKPAPVESENPGVDLEDEIPF